MTDLSDKMRALAAGKDLPHFEELAHDFDAAASGFYAEPQVVSEREFLRAWARARRAWCAETGEPLI